MLLRYNGTFPHSASNWFFLDKREKIEEKFQGKKSHPEIRLTSPHALECHDLPHSLYYTYLMYVPSTIMCVGFNWRPRWLRTSGIVVECNANPPYIQKKNLSVTYFSSSSSYYLRIEEETGDNGNGYDGGIGAAGLTVTEETFS